VRDPSGTDETVFASGLRPGVHEHAGANEWLSDVGVAVPYIEETELMGAGPRCPRWPRSTPRNGDP
jgi:hypothetical protein